MDKFKENAPVVMVVLACVLVLAAVAIIVMNWKLVKNLVARRFGFHDYKEVDKNTGAEFFSAVVANRSLSDVAVSEIGLAIKGKKGLKYFDFQDNYRAENNISSESRPVISQRSSIKLSVGVPEAEELIFANVDGKYKKTFVYVVDSSGNVSRARAKNLHKVLKADYLVALKRASFEKAALSAPTFGEKFRLLFGRPDPALLRDPAPEQPLAAEETQSVPEPALTETAAAEEIEISAPPAEESDAPAGEEADKEE